MNPIVMETTLVRADWDALNQYILRRLSPGTWVRHGFAIWAIGAFAVCAVAGYLLRSVGLSMEVTDVLIAVIICMAISALVARYQLRDWRPRDVGYVLGPCRFEIDASGIRTIGTHRTNFLEWRCIESIDETAEHLFLPVDRIMAFMLPKRDLTPEAVEVIQDLARNAGVNANAATAQRPVTAGWPAPAPQAQAQTQVSPTIGFFDALLSNFRAGLWLLSLRRPKSAFIALFDQAAVFGVLTCATLFLLTWIGAESGSEFLAFGLFGWLYFAGVGVLAAFLIARAQSPRTDVVALLVPVLTIAPFAATMICLLDQFAEPHIGERAVWLIALCIATAYTAVAVRTAYEPARPLAHAATVVVVLAFASLTQNTPFFFSSPWQPPYDEDALEEDLYGAETLLFDQPARITAAVNRMAPQQEGRPDVFFLSFAGHGFQNVFRHEALFAQEVFAHRYGSGERSLALINDDEDQDGYPLAMGAGLREALKQVGAKMNRDEDIAVVMLTSHGSRDGELTVTHPKTPLRSLTAKDVRSALDGAGIRWRVVIVSACYAGTFIEPLSNPETVVITAADSDHNSFGCADDRDLTYFGEAFLRDALPGAENLSAAFKRAREIIAKRETAEGKPHSNPQMFVGREIAGRLEVLEAARRAE
jgi:hypothetical protein